MKTHVTVYDITSQRKLGNIHISKIDQYYDQWRGKGYGVLIDRDGCVCIDMEDPEDDGKYYSDQITDLNKL
ncbi:hypothetical protein [Aquimarina mytili]|uniref:WG repeat-containing protein n=1 Tax=Aquimarina mytili TaxID=874423 RepID=A0A937DDJ4_9FLAO|nr:hypothetical protein [Aquimarina mytili]MBL0686096.1 hypothetical protein [Aquimarina mytili]